MSAENIVAIVLMAVLLGQMLIACVVLWWMDELCWGRPGHLLDPEEQPILIH